VGILEENPERSMTMMSRDSWPMSRRRRTRMMRDPQRYDHPSGRRCLPPSPSW
jgi:hypothetical protein